MRRRRLALLSFALVLPLALASRSAAVPFSLALSLDGTDDYADIADNASLDLGTGATDDFTIEAFVFVPDQSNDSNGVVFFKNLAYGLLVNFNTSSDDVLIFDFWSCPSSFCEGQLLVQQNLSNGWHHIAAVFDNEFTNDNDRAGIYLDGSEVASASNFEFTPGVNNSVSSLNVGANVGAVPFPGFVDEARLSSSVRYSGSYTVPASPFTPDGNTRALWHFDDHACSTSFADSSGNGNTLTGHNGAQTALQGATAPTLQFDGASSSVAEGGTATITVTRSGDPVPAVGVHYATSDGSAGSSDYTSASGSLAFACGEMSKTFDVHTTQDSSFETDETVNLGLDTPTGGASLGSPSAAALTINDDDQPVLQFDSASSSISEAGGTASIAVTRSGNPSVPVAVDYARKGGTATPGTDFNLAPGTLMFGAGVTSRNILVPIVNDSNQEPKETISVELSSPTGGAAIGTPSTHVLSIAASDQQPDALVGLKASSGFIGNDVYNANGAHQTETVKAPRGDRSVFFAKVQNDGTGKNPFVIRGTGSTAGAKIRYFLGTSSTEITKAMTGAGFKTSLAKGASRLIRVEITVLSKAPIGSVQSALVSGTWTGDSVRLDAARASVKVTA